MEVEYKTYQTMRPLQNAFGPIGRLVPSVILSGTLGLRIAA